MNTIIKSKNLFFLFISVITTASCSYLDLKEYDGDISSDELFTSDRLSYRFKNEILADQTDKQNLEKEPIKNEEINTDNKRTPTAIHAQNDNDNFKNFKLWRKSNPESDDYEDYLIWLEYQKYLNKIYKQEQDK